MIAAAMADRGTAFKLAIALWFQVGLNRQARTVSLPSKVLGEFGVARHSLYRGLKALEKAGLVSVQRANGRKPLITLLEADGGESE